MAKRKTSYLKLISIIFFLGFTVFSVLLFINNRLLLDKFDRDVTEKIGEYSNPIIEMDLRSKIEKTTTLLEKELADIKSSTIILANLAQEIVKINLPFSTNTFNQIVNMNYHGVRYSNPLDDTSFIFVSKRSSYNKLAIEFILKIGLTLTRGV
ncbi:MAG: hypothetical protein WCG27_08015 [Pseudomonadota bacterium]